MEVIILVFRIYIRIRIHIRVMFLFIFVLVLIASSCTYATLERLTSSEGDANISNDRLRLHRNSFSVSGTYEV